MNYKTILKALINAIPDDIIPDLKDVVDLLIDKLEAKFADNDLVMAICAKVRSGADIPDED